MAVDIRESTVGSGEHVVHFYEHDVELVAGLCAYLAAAIRDGEAAIVIATQAHRRAFEAELEAQGIDIAQARVDGRFVSLDAAATMAAFVHEGRIDRDAFREVIGGLLRNAAAGVPAIRAYGEMVALLWEDGDVLAAIELEMLWNHLGRELPFSLYCSYPATSVAGSEHAEAVHQLCHLHCRVLTSAPAEGGDAQELTDTLAGTGASTSFPADPGSPGRARRMAATTLRRWGHGERLVDDASLVVSELASNAVRHAGSAFTVALEMQGSLLRVAVEDLAPLPVPVPDAYVTPQQLHGLGVIDALCARWGVEPTREGKVVWAQLACAATPVDPPA
jgi:hypothetical protein